MPITTFHGGKLPAQPARPHLRLGSYMTTALPAPPATIDWLGEVTDWPMYLNDQLGDCTIAELGHQVELITALGSGAAVKVTDKDVLTAYEKITGYNPKNPSTDQGAYIQDVLGYWLKNGFAGHKILAYASVDISNMTQVKQAIDLFGSVNIGFDFPASAMDQFNAGEPWDVVKGSQIEGGHCVMVGGYEANGNLDCVTWGALQEMTPAFWKKYVDEAWVAISAELFSADGKDMTGIDLYTLGQDYAALTGKTNPIPQPVDPQPDPGPAPSPPDDDASFAAELREWIALAMAWLKKKGI